MTTKDDILNYITKLSEQNIITKDELIDAYELGTDTKQDVVFTKKLGISEILYYIGGAIVFLGIAILLSQNWASLSFFTKVLVTLGTGLITYFLGLFFSLDEKTEPAGAAFYLISALVTPIGLMVVFDYASFDIGSFGIQSVISGIMTGSYLLSLLILRKNIFTLFSLLFGTWFFFSFTSWLVGGAPYFNDWKYYMYRVLILGLSYILFGYGFSKNEKKPLTGFLYGFGSLCVLGSALALGSWTPNQNIFWELSYPAIVFGIMFLSVQLKSKSFLTWSTLFLMLYILKITSEYFTSGLGWPLALVISGLSLIGIGAMSISIRKKYLV